MTSDAVKNARDKEHEAVRSAFRAARFDDEPPAEVDAAILAAARSARPRSLHGVLPPLALAATVVLALGLVLRLAIPTREPAIVSDGLPLESAPTTFETGNLSEEGAPGRAEAVRQREPAAPASADAAVSAPAAATESSVAREATTAIVGGAARPATEALNAPASDCAAQFGAEPDGWLDCIAALLDAGEAAAARRELAAFSARFPDRSVPARIESRLAP
jgi:hypothetical protein